MIPVLPARFFLPRVARVLFLNYSPHKETVTSCTGCVRRVSSQTDRQGSSPHLWLRSGRARSAARGPGLTPQCADGMYALVTHPPPPPSHLPTCFSPARKRTIFTPRVRSHPPLTPLCPPAYSPTPVLLLILLLNPSRISPRHAPPACSLHGRAHTTRTHHSRDAHTQTPQSTTRSQHPIASTPKSALPLPVFLCLSTSPPPLLTLPIRTARCGAQPRGGLLPVDEFHRRGASADCRRGALLASHARALSNGARLATGCCDCCSAKCLSPRHTARPSRLAHVPGTLQLPQRNTTRF